MAGIISIRQRTQTNNNMTTALWYWCCGIVVIVMTAASHHHNVEAFVSPSTTRTLSSPSGWFVVPTPRGSSSTSSSSSSSSSSTTTTTTTLSFFNNLFGPEPGTESTPASSKKVIDKVTTTTKRQKDEEEDEPDLVEKIFGVFFGVKEESPMGLKRFGKDRFPEQYPATTTEWADPVIGDDKDVMKLRPLLKNTNLEFRQLQLSYSANRDGWNPQSFHAKVDRKGPSLAVATTTSGLVVGGYNPKGWVSYGEARGSIAAFLFVQQDTSSSPFGWKKLRKVGGPSLAQLDYPESGPLFGADSLVIPLNGNNPKQARSKLGSYYERFEDGTNSLFGPKQASVQLKDLKVYQGVYEPGEFIPFTDAEPFALY